MATKATSTAADEAASPTAVGAPAPARTPLGVGRA